MKLHKVEVFICEGCLEGIGQCCSTPGCIFIRQHPPEFPMDKSQLNILYSYEEVDDVDEMTEEEFNEWMGYPENSYMKEPDE